MFGYVDTVYEAYRTQARNKMFNIMDEKNNNISSWSYVIYFSVALIKHT